MNQRLEVASKQDGLNFRQPPQLKGGLNHSIDTESSFRLGSIFTPKLVMLDFSVRTK